MFRPIILSVSFVALVANAHGCASYAANAELNSEKGEGIRIEFPIPEQGEDLPKVPEPIWTVAISEDGNLSVEDKQLSPRQFRSKVRSTKTTDSKKIGVSPSGDTRAEHVTDLLSKSNDTSVFQFLGLETHRKWDQAKGANGRVLTAPEFEGEPELYELPVSVRFFEAGNQCIVGIEDKTLDSVLLYELSFAWLDTRIMHAGGAEAVLNAPEILDSLVARVQVDAKTPWRCVAGSLYAIQAAGWPTVQIEVSDK